MYLSLVIVTSKYVISDSPGESVSTIDSVNDALSSYMILKGDTLFHRGIAELQLTTPNKPGGAQSSSSPLLGEYSGRLPN